MFPYQIPLTKGTCCGNKSPSLALGILLVTSLVCIHFSLEEERVMQHRSSKYFPQFENQGIDPEGGPRQVQSTCANTNKLAPNASKGLSIPSRLFAK